MNDHYFELKIYAYDYPYAWKIFQEYFSILEMKTKVGMHILDFSL